MACPLTAQGKKRCDSAMNQYVLSRLQAIQQSLVAHHLGGTGMPDAMTGSERERFVSDFLAQVMPPLYRFGRGTITDTDGGLCGQVEVIMEFPFSPSLPTPFSSERLYLAESVAAVIEVKSNLIAQWTQVEKTTEMVRRLKRKLEVVVENVVREEGGEEEDERIPCYAVGYTGYKTLDGLRDRLESTPQQSRPSGALVIESGCFVGSEVEATGAWGLYHFIAELIEYGRRIVSACPDAHLYGEYSTK